MKKDLNYCFFLIAFFINNLTYGSVPQIHIMQRDVSNETQKNITRHEIYQKVSDNQIVYDKFMKGKLVLVKNGKTVEFKFNQFYDAGVGEFDLTDVKFQYHGFLLDLDKYFRIKLGVREFVEDEAKTTLWITPKFMVDKIPSHPWNDVPWSSEIGVFWSWGKYSIDKFDYLTSWNFNKFKGSNAYDLPSNSVFSGHCLKSCCSVCTFFGSIPWLIFNYPVYGFIEDGVCGNIKCRPYILCVSRYAYCSPIVVGNSCGYALDECLFCNDIGFTPTTHPRKSFGYIFAWELQKGISIDFS